MSGDETRVFVEFVVAEERRWMVYAFQASLLVVLYIHFPPLVVVRTQHVAVGTVDIFDVDCLCLEPGIHVAGSGGRHLAERTVEEMEV